MVRRILNLFVFCLVSVVVASGVTAEEQDVSGTYVGEPLEIGIAALTVNTVTGTIQNKVVKIAKSDSIYQWEIIETAANSTTQFLFLDETVLTIGPESRLVLDEMFFDPNGTKGKVTISAMKGLFTFITGSLPSESYEVKTPTTTIGVRGTKFDLFVARNGASTVILRSGAVDVKNLQGVTRRISKLGLATRVSTRASPPTKPARPSVELETLFKPLANPDELRGKSPKQVNATRENVEYESNKIKETLLRLEKVEIEKKKQVALGKTKTKAELRREKKQAQLDKKAKKLKLQKKKKQAKLDKKTKKLELQKKKKLAQVDKKAKKLELQKKKKQAKLDKKTNKATKTAKLATSGAKQVAKTAQVASKKSAVTAKQASKAAKKASKKSAVTAKQASKAAKKASKKAAMTAKKASKKAAAVAKKASKKAAAVAKKASKKAAVIAKKASKAAKRAAKRARRARRVEAKKAALSD